MRPSGCLQGSLPSLARSCNYHNNSNGNNNNNNMHGPNWMMSNDVRAWLVYWNVDNDWDSIGLSHILLNLKKLNSNFFKFIMTKSQFSLGYLSIHLSFRLSSICSLVVLSLSSSLLCHALLTWDGRARFSPRGWLIYHTLRVETYVRTNEPTCIRRMLLRALKDKLGGKKSI